MSSSSSRAGDTSRGSASAHRPEGAVALALGQRLGQVDEVIALDDFQDVGEPEVVEVPHHRHVGRRVLRQDLVDEIVDDRRLLHPLDLGDALGRPKAPKQWLVSTLRVGVVVDDEQGLAGVGELRCERLPPACPCGIGRLDTSGAELSSGPSGPVGSGRSGGIATRTGDELKPSVLAIEVADADLAARFAAVLVAAGAMSVNEYTGPPAATIASTNA